MSKINNNPTVGIIMGSKSDWKGVMEHCSEIFKEFGICYSLFLFSDVSCSFVVCFSRVNAKIKIYR